MRLIFVRIVLCVAVSLARPIGYMQIIIPNSGFEEKDANSNTGLAKWTLESEGVVVTIDSIQPARGKYAVRFSREAPNGMGFFFQQLPFSSRSLKKYKISCMIKTTGLTGVAGLGARIFDENGNTITGYRAISVTTNQDWKKMEGEFYSDEKAVSLRIFGNITGAGTIWFDEVKIEEIKPSGKKPGKKVLAYINEYFEYIRKYSIVRDSAYIDQLKANTIKLCAGYDDQNYCQQIFKRYTTLKLNDGHSFFFTSEEWNQYSNGSANTIEAGLVNFVTGHMTADHIAYLDVPTFASLDSQLLQQYVQHTQELIKELDQQSPVGWIIDLSNNQGGNSFAMLPGLGPLLGNGICGYSQSADGSKRTRIYDNGYAGWHPDTTFIQQTPLYHLERKNPPIAIIYSGMTGSSGEVTAISFRGKENTKSFGQTTAGATTRVDNLELSDGASLNLACGWDADRTGKVYKTGVPPDVITNDHEEALRQATIWILSGNK